LTRHSHLRPDNQRMAVANEAARIIQEEGLADFRSAKEKAIERLGLYAGGTRLPSNEEVEQALAERQRIFRGNDHPALLYELRQAALSILRTLEIYHARLVGPVLSGTATDFSVIDLHLFSDSPEAVGVTLDVLGLSNRAIQTRHQFRRGEGQRFPGYRFRTQDFEYRATVFSINHRRRSPLSPIDGKPMFRASIQTVETLLGN
jgi:hypothetical protein